MRNPLVRGILVAIALLVAFGTGSASADNEYVGRTYDGVASQITGWGGTPVIWTRDGSYLPTEKCMVVGSKYAKSLDSSGQRRDYGRVLLDLNCNDTAATGIHPGYSVMTPQGQKEQKRRQESQWLSSDYEKNVAAGKDPWCKGHEASCIKACTASGTCSKELLQYLGM